MFKVVVHELGHSLGLDHSRDKNAVMYPYYTGVLSFGSYDLPQDDLEGSGNIFQRYLSHINRANLCFQASRTCTGDLQSLYRTLRVRSCTSLTPFRIRCCTVVPPFSCSLTNTTLKWPVISASKYNAQLLFYLTTELISINTDFFRGTLKLHLVTGMRLKTSTPFFLLTVEILN